MFALHPPRTAARTARCLRDRHTAGAWVCTHTGWLLGVAIAWLAAGEACGQQQVFPSGRAVSGPNPSIQQPAGLGGAGVVCETSGLDLTEPHADAHQALVPAAYAETRDAPPASTWQSAGPRLASDGYFEPAGPAFGPVRGSFRHLSHWLQPQGYQPSSPRQTWLFRPYSVDWFAGGVWGGAVIDDWVSQSSGFVGGVRLGWDADPFWGVEMRVALGELELTDSSRAITAQQTADDKAGLEDDDPLRLRFDRRRALDLFLWDINLIYYPLGDTRLRPFAMIGLGTAKITFKDRLSNEYDEIVLGMPVGGGIKWRCNDWLGLHCTLTDNIALSGGRGFNTLHELSLTGGVEIRFGGSRRSYWPWNPGKFYW